MVACFVQAMAQRDLHEALLSDTARWVGSRRQHNAWHRRGAEGQADDPAAA